MTTQRDAAIWVAALTGVLTVSLHGQRANMPPLVTQAQYNQWQTELSNWGRWGPDDELGAANLITPTKRAEAAALVEDGFTVSLASDAEKVATIANPCPIEWSMVRATRTAASDTVAYPCIHGPGTTHLDAFAHIFSMARCGTATMSTAWLRWRKGRPRTPS